MSFDQLLDALPDFAKDQRLNLQAVLSDEGGAGLTARQRFYVALSSAYATKDAAVIAAIRDRAGEVLAESDVQSAKAAATVMAMNNIYYRFQHLTDDPDLKKLPAKLRMNIIGNPGVEKIDFELACLAVSAQNGCGQCMVAHVNGAKKAGVTPEGIQTSVRIASVVSAVAQAFAIRSL